MRQILLDTETTGFEPENGDRIIEIGAVEMIKRRVTQNSFHQYIHPQRTVPQEAIAVHGITDDFLQDKPPFADIVEDFMQFVAGAELIIHNAPFDVGFINHELSQLNNNTWGTIEAHCKITDSLKVARKAYPGQRNSLDALCKRLGIDNSNRTLHGALLDSEILADVYLGITGGQTKLTLADDNDQNDINVQNQPRLRQDRPNIKVITANATELALHQKKLTDIAQKSGQTLDW